jgi:chromosome segregation ATPase
MELPFLNPTKQKETISSRLDIMIRLTRSPHLIIMGILFVISITSYKYWRLTTYTNELKEQIYANDERYNQYTFEKSSLEKDKEVCLGRIKFFEELVEKNQQALNKKSSEINDLGQRLKDGELKLDQHQQDLNKKDGEITNLNQRLKDNEAKLEQIKTDADAKSVLHCFCFFEQINPISE